jgi:putative PIN family toxin of toxin-antitoxin system
VRLVVDTNIFVSAALKHASWPASTIRRIDRHGGLLKSPTTEQELMAVLDRPRIASKIAPGFLSQLHRMLALAELVAITEPVAACRDPDDDKFLELAVNGNADAIISGDADLLALDTFAESRSSRRPHSSVRIRGSHCSAPADSGQAWAARARHLDAAALTVQHSA